jgi:putative heme-binding domain-containing protein
VITEPKIDVFFPPPESVVIAAIHAASLWRDQKAVPVLVARLKSDSPLIRRAAAEALGRIGDDIAVEHLLKALANKDNDRSLDHSITHALIELDNREYLKNSLDHESPRVRRACLAALDQLGEKLDPKVVLAEMKSGDPALKETAHWIAGRHPEWADDVAAFFREQLAARGKPDEREALAGELARFAKDSGFQRLLADVALDPKAAKDARKTALAAMARAGLKEVPEVWRKALTDILAADSDLWPEAIATIRSFPIAKGKENDYAVALRQVSDSDSGASFDVRLAAMAASPAGGDSPKDHLVQQLLEALDRDQPATKRGLAAEALSKARLQPEQFGAVIAALPKIGPLELDRVLAAFAQTKDDEIGKKLVAALNTPEVRPALRVDGVRERIKHFGPAVQAEAEKLYANLNAALAQQRARLDEVAKSLKPGDVRRGQAVFNSQKNSCIACHTIGYVGGKIGPDLTRVGGIRTERDLLESILFPSASFVRSYEPLTVVTKDQKTFNGIPKKDSPEELVLILAADKEVRIAKEDIEEVRPGKVSIMPDGLDKQLTEQELADLIAFLKGCK